MIACVNEKKMLICEGYSAVNAAKANDGTIYKSGDNDNNKTRTKCLVLIM